MLQCTKLHKYDLLRAGFVILYRIDFGSMIEEAP